MRIAASASTAAASKQRKSSSSSSVAPPTDVRSRLATKAPYAFRLPTPGAPSLHRLPDPADHAPVFIYTLARHGSRWPTSARAAQMRSLAPLLQVGWVGWRGVAWHGSHGGCTLRVHECMHACALSDPGRSSLTSHNRSHKPTRMPTHAQRVDPKLHPWARNVSTPTHDYAAGELHPTGEDEMISLARRLRGRFPSLLERGPYFPKRYPIISTQVARAAQSASAFALGFFERGSSSNADASTSSSNRVWPQPVAISMLPKRHDAVLRFFECPAYLQHEDTAERWMVRRAQCISAPRVHNAQRLPAPSALHPDPIQPTPETAP